MYDPTRFNFTNTNKHSAKETVKKSQYGIANSYGNSFSSDDSLNYKDLEAKKLLREEEKERKIKYYIFPFDGYTAESVYVRIGADITGIKQVINLESPEGQDYNSQAAYVQEIIDGLKAGPYANDIKDWTLEIESVYADQVGYTSETSPYLNMGLEPFPVLAISKRKGTYLGENEVLHWLTYNYWTVEDGYIFQFEDFGGPDAVYTIYDLENGFFQDLYPVDVGFRFVYTDGSMNVISAEQAITGYRDNPNSRGIIPADDTNYSWLNRNISGSI